MKGYGMDYSMKIVKEIYKSQVYCVKNKNRTLRHTAGCPWNQYARYGSAILCTTAQEFRTVASFGILILIDRCIHNNAQELVTHNEIEQDA